MICVRTCRLLTDAVFVWCAVVTGVVAAPAQDPIAKLRAQAEAARQSTVPAPPLGVRDLQWGQLSPPGWNPARTLERLGVAKLEDADPRANAIMAEIRSEWERAPAVSAPPDAAVRLTGFPVMLEDTTGAVRTIILAPYYGACIHSPTPAANQMVLVKLNHELPSSMYQYPIWVSGKITVKSTQTRHGRVAYLMTDAKWEPYPYQKYPMPQYQLPR